MAKFDLARAINGQVGAASVSALEMTKPETQRTIEVITSEILRLKTDAGNAIIGIGERLIEAKDKLPHGEWLPWLNEKVDFSERTARNFMRLAREWTNRQALADLGSAKALTLLALPEPEREEFMVTHDVPNMSTRELEQAIRERDEAKAAAEKERLRASKAEDALTAERKKTNNAIEANTELFEANQQLKEHIKELENRPVDVAVQVDEEAVKKAADEARAAAEAEWSAKVKEAEDKLAKAEEKAERAKEKAKKAGEQTNGEVANLKAEAEQLRAELERAKREQAKASISGDADLAAFQLLFEAAQTDVNKMRGILLKVRGREGSELGEKLTAALLALAEKVKECAA